MMAIELMLELEHPILCCDLMEVCKRSMVSGSR